MHVQLTLPPGPTLSLRDHHATWSLLSRTPSYKPASSNRNAAYSRHDLSLLWAQAVPISYTTRITDGVKTLPPILAQSNDTKCPISIPTISRMLDALLDQACYRVIFAENFLGKLGNRPKYHLQNFVRYLHLEKPQQRERVLPELAERDRGEVEAIINTVKRKPLVTLASLQNKEFGKPIQQTVVVGQLVTCPLWAQELSFEHLLGIARTQTDREQASFLPNTPLSSAFPSLLCLPNCTTSLLAHLYPFHNSSWTPYL